MQFKKLFRGSNKYFSIFGLSILLVIIAGIISPIAEDIVEKSWEDKLENETKSIESQAYLVFKNIEQNLINTKNELIANLKKDFGKSKSATYLFDRINKESNKNYITEIFNSEFMLKTWNHSTVFDSSKLKDEFHFYGESFFSDRDLVVYLSVKDTFSLGSDSFIIVQSVPIEKKYFIGNTYYNKLSIKNKLENNFDTQFKINFSHNAKPSMDGREYSASITNNFGNKIGQFTFRKPTRDYSLIETGNFFTALQSLLLLNGIVFLAFGFRKDFLAVENNFYKFLLISFYLIVFRVLIFMLGIPSEFLSGKLVSAGYFSSTFGYGIVKSPIEFFITAVIFFLITYKALNYSINSIGKSNFKTIYRILIAAFFVILFLIALRSFGASIRSVIFDSSLRYFKDPDLLPNSPMALMQLSVLIFSFSVLIGCISFLIVIINQFRKNNKLSKLYFVLLFIGLQILGEVYDLTQVSPQGTPLIRILFITLTFLITYRILFVKHDNLNFIFTAFAASFFAIIIMNHYNLQLEKESIKYTALELTWPNENWLDFIVLETLSVAAEEKDKLITNSNNKNNYSAKAFNIWGNSLLQKESVNSEVVFIDSSGNVLGEFTYGFPKKYKENWNVSELNYNGLYTFERIIGGNQKVKKGVLPVHDYGLEAKFICVSVMYDINSLLFSEVPEFISTRRAIVDSTLNINSLKIFEFKNGELISSFGDYTLSDSEIDSLVNVNFSADGSAWITAAFNDELHYIYLVNAVRENSEKILAVALKEKDVSWNLYDFFKVFFVHSIYIILGIVFVSIVYLAKQRAFKYSFRSKLLAAFLFISIIPLFLLAAYIRDLTEDKNDEAIIYKLKKRADRAGKYFDTYLSSSTINPETVYKKAVYDLGINFTLFDGREMVYSTDSEYYEIELLSRRLNPVVYNQMMNKGYNESIVKENVDNFYYNSFYTRVNILDKEFILNVNDAFNSILLPMSETEVDIFLFGSYSLAGLLIIIFSTVLANQISSPIRKLTQATNSVAHGDLDIQLEEPTRGEVKDLITGFNMMVNELKRSQAELAKAERETAWKEMAKQVAHEIKNPLTPMKLSVQQLIIAKKDGSDKFDHIFEKVTETVIKQIESLKNIASEFSSFARMPGLKVELFDLLPLVNESVNLFNEESVEFKIEKNIDSVKIEADRDQLKRSLINLIRNSLQANSSSIKVDIKSIDEFVIINISDNGKGVDPANSDKIFEDNFTTKEKGMGLGLSMTKRYLENLGGEISLVKSSVSGTTFQIKIPISV
ncbi:MAG: HAMP domain-containing protein [Melioribacteraceae bacterium]|nr:HAMP domain-containing protein [Melioribacteraceae bacterium]MCF8355808.1 HAMP domain-containing protein [Melioribacteraceae bacterium]MCF8395298.1 HAMP domain-containing protein [Melioribacteraceae bacterium]MCF8420746.1 HAMP domain-containing protein [Melioribacteraceae bacterium]